jgi:hypothetical protein
VTETHIKAIAADYGGYAVTCRVPQLPLRVRWDAEEAVGGGTAARIRAAGTAGVPGGDRLMTGVRAA